jgi:hypothetical protein
MCFTPIRTTPHNRLRSGTRSALFAATFACAPAPAADHVWFIGGGFDADNSQAQIETNVLWASRVVRELPGRRTQRVFFTDGVGPAADVKEYPPPAGSYSEPLARLYDIEEIGGYLYRNHRVPHVDGATARGELLPRLERELKALQPADNVLIVFNGHGTRGRFTSADNRLWLWNETTLTVREFEQLLNKAPQGVTVRFVLTQCFSGGFARAVYAGAGNGLPLAPGERCGFLAESEDEPAEGCSAAVESSDYRDYTTYFFAALAGRTRHGGRLAFNPDRDGNGATDLREAHLYALRAGDSSDVPRSTSEDFLERWRPWWPEWRAVLGMTEAPDNLYTRLASEVAAAAGLPVESRALGKAIKSQRRVLRREGRRLERERRALERKIVALQETLREGLAVRWPKLGEQGRGAARGPKAGAAEAEAWVRGRPEYPALVAGQDRYAAITQAQLDQERRLTRLDRIERLRRLGQWLARFEREASEGDRAAYERLVACERRGL